MICWWCGKRLTNPFGKPVEGEEIEIPKVPAAPGGISVDYHKVRVHKVCAYDARDFLQDAKVTARPTGDTLT